MQQPYVNLIRSTIEALAAVLGGTQSLHVNSFDEAWALPTEEAVLLSLRTQQVIAHESGVANTVDPLGGAYFVEWMTDQMEAGAREYFRRIEEEGGVIPAIKSGFFQQEIADAAYRFQQRVEERDFIWVGVNEYQMRRGTYPVPHPENRTRGAREAGQAARRPASSAGQPRRRASAERPRRCRAPRGELDGAHPERHQSLRDARRDGQRAQRGVRNLYGGRSDLERRRGRTPTPTSTA
jgi:methylmalonyl-CoA mutase N-terminal domain/subunit